MIYNQNRIPNSAWNTLQGVILDGGYELKEALDVSDGAAAFRVRILGSGGREGTAHFFQLDPKAADDQIDIWETLREIPHPNLAAPMATGKRELEGAQVIYVVIADPDEKLVSIIPERPLEWEEAAELLSSVEKGLAHLHAYGLVHGCVSPETVGAVGYSIQLATECVRRLNQKPLVQISKPRFMAPESVGENTSTQADVWCLGATLFEVTSQTQYGSEGAVSVQGLPLGAVIKRCLETDPRTRCTLKEAPALGAKSSAEPAPPVPAATSAQSEGAAPTSASPASGDSRPAGTAKPQFRTSAAVIDIPEATKHRPAVNDKPRVSPSVEKQRAQAAAARTVAARDMILVPTGKRHRGVKRQAVGAKVRTTYQSPSHAEDALASSADSPFRGIVRVRPRPGMWRTIIATTAAAAAIIAALWLIIIPRLQSPVEHAQTQEQNIPAASVSAPYALEAIPPPSRESPVSVTSVSMKPVERDIAANNKWRVVLASFALSTDAERRVQVILSNYPGVQAHVYSPNETGPFFVVTGDAMSRAEADEIRDRVVALGIPNSAHVERFRD